MNAIEIQKTVADLFAKIGRLLTNGVPLLSALEVTGSELNDSPELQRILERMRHGIEVGKTFADSMREFPLFPELVTMAVSAGERQGNLDEQLIRIAESITVGDFPVGELPSLASLNAAPVDASSEMLQSIPELVEGILARAYDARASDVHIDPGEGGSVLRFRIDGVLYRQPESLTREQHTVLVSRLKILASCDIAERKLPQDGRILRSYDTVADEDDVSPEVDLRASFCPFVHGEKVVIRFLYKYDFPDSLSRIMSEDQTKTIKGWLRRPFGLIVVTGPTACGKTTTVYLMLRELAKGEMVNILSVEDPVEFLLPGIQQMQVNPSIGLTFNAALRAFLRLDPDIIHVGEIREPETAVMLSKVALTGHLALTQHHAQDVLSVINLLTEIGVDAYVLRQVLTGVVSQRLVRKLCTSCRTRMPDEDRAALPGPFSAITAEMFQAEGCDECSHTGYRGRIALFEMFEPTLEFWNAHGAGAPFAELLAEEDDNFMPFRQEAARMLSEGITSWSEIARVCEL